MFSSKITPEARWLLEALIADAQQRTTPSWASVSAFHHLRTRPPQEHPGFGTALLQWQRMVARFGSQAPVIAAEAFLAMPRSDASPGHGVASRVLELWSRHVPLNVEVSGRLALLLEAARSHDEARVAAARLLAEDLALGAYEGGKPSKGILEIVAGLDGDDFHDARALAQLERYQRGQIDGRALLAALAPGLASDEQGTRVPELTVHLLGGLRHPQHYVPENVEGLAPVLAELRNLAAACPAEHPAADEARRLVACASELSAADVIALAEPDRAAGFSGQRLPAADAVIAAVAGIDEERAVRVALLFPSLSGAVERGTSLSGLTRWRAAREPDAPLAAARSARDALDPAQCARWDSWAGAAAPGAGPGEVSWDDRLLRSLRTGELFPRDALLAAPERYRQGLLFDSPGGPGLLGSDGQLRNSLRAWPAPEQLRVAHPIDFYDAERQAWQARLLASGQVSPLNQLFREVHRASARELARKRLERLRASPLGPAGLALLARRGWFPMLSPAEVAPELELGELRARLVVETGPQGLVNAGLEFLRGTALVALDQVPPRLLSEAWRDVDEALALCMPSTSWVPVGARAELVRALAPRLGLSALRVEADHVAFRSAERPERITLHNGRAADGVPEPEAELRTRGAAALPFADDGGVAALLVGRILARARPELDQAEGRRAPGESP